MSTSSKVLRDIWVNSGGDVIAEGDAGTIDDWLAGKLERIAGADGGWRILYRNRETACYWELTYPDSGLHGGGPRVLRELDIDDPAHWSSSETS